MKRVSSKLVLAAALAMLACSKDTPTGPQPGTLSVQLQTPNGGADGAILFTLSGPTTVTNVQASAGDTLWTSDFSGTTTKVVLTGAIGSGVILRFDVPDVSQYGQYLASISQVASSSDYSLRSLTNYVAFVSK
jgi:hypothetical protein